ncbi:hypothetical protein [Legionella worsleiensis]|nr:hypothetical protein [Legionella worsleiensis]
MEPYQGETLIYDPAADPNIIANNENNLEKLLRLKVHSLASINLTLQVINNINLYIIRQQQINALKCLFDQELIPAINEFQKDGKIPGDVLEYFALAVRDIMVNSKLNNKDTLFELNFKENNEPIPVEFNYEIRAVYAKKMISSLSYLVNERIEPDTQDLELRRWLINFKRHLHLNDESIRKYSLRTKDLAFIRKTISSLEQSIVCSGLIDHDYRLIKTDDLIENGQLDFALLVAAIGAMHEGETTLRYALERLDKESYQIPERIGISIPEPLTSLSCIIKTWFQTILSQTTKDKLKEQGLINLVKKILNVVIPLFSSATKGDSRCVEARFISHTIHTSDTDVYVTRIWKEALNECFLRETPHLNQKVKEKVKPEKLQHLLFKITQDVLNEQLKLLLTAEHDIQSQASCSSSSSV